MINHLYSNLLDDPTEYSLSENYWRELWQSVSDQDRSRFGWQEPWFQPLPPRLGQGNPIFSAFSPLLRRGLRVIQHAPTRQTLEIQAWPDSFGGPITDPESIRELVIACALSDLAVGVAMDLIQPWVANRPVTLRTTLVGDVPYPARSSEPKLRISYVMTQGYDAA